MLEENGRRHGFAAWGGGAIAYQISGACPSVSTTPPWSGARCATATKIQVLGAAGSVTGPIHLCSPEPDEAVIGEGAVYLCGKLSANNGHTDVGAVCPVQVARWLSAGCLHIGVDVWVSKADRVK